MNKNAKILLVEDNEGDIVLTLEALKDAKADNSVMVVKRWRRSYAISAKTGEV